jgi:glyoxylase-like metal-dependent hydrolase (beta-lactamase superfamily II)
MCKVSRRAFLATNAGFLTAAAEAELLGRARQSAPPPARPNEVAPGIFFFEGDPFATGSNRGWVVFSEYVLVIDASFPAGAEQTVRAIRAVTDRPFRFAFDTHHHGDHAYGNQVFTEQGATAVAHIGVLEEMRRLESGFYGGTPGRWEDEAKSREDLKTRKLEPPSLLFPNKLIFDDGRQRVELIHFGIAHTRGDAFAWVPQHKILFTGDACVNGAWNFVGDGDVRQWIRTLDEPRKLAPRILCPGHGPLGDRALLDDQQQFFRRLTEEVERRLSANADVSIGAAVEDIRRAIRIDPRIARYASGTRYDPFPEQVAKVYGELTGKKLAGGTDASRSAARMHAMAHGLA